MHLRHRRALAIGFLLGVTATAPAFAQATRTWVSGVGDDANPCSRTAPCKTFAGAISKTAAGGEINALDPGGYGTVNITKSITIDGAGTNASILASGVHGVIISAGASDLVVLRNLNISGVPSTSGAVSGVRVLNAGRVLLQNLSIGRMGHGIEVSSASAALRVDAQNVTLSSTVYGVTVTAPNAQVTLGNMVIRGNLTAINGQSGRIWLDDSQLFDNVTAIGSGGATVYSFENNRLAGNGTDGNVSGTVLKK